MTVEDFKHVLRTPGSIENCPVTVQDVVIAEDLFGPSLGYWRGKNTRMKPKAIKYSTVSIPPEIKERGQNLTWCMDLMFVNGKPFMTGIDTSVRKRTATKLKKRDAKTLHASIKKTLNEYDKNGYHVSHLNCDGQFKPLVDTFKNDVKKNLRCDINCVGKNEHEPTAERNNRTIAAALRCKFSDLPYKAVPHLMAEYIVMDQVKRINQFPAKEGVSDYYSPDL